MACTLFLSFTFVPTVLHAAAPTGPFPTWKHLSSANNDLPTPNGGKNQTSLLVLDVDKDGHNDIVVAERTVGPALVWLRRDHAAGSFTRHVIDENPAPIAAGGTFCDVDGNGSLDLVFGSSGLGTSVWWWENPAPRGDPKSPWKRHIIVNNQKGMHHDQLAGDFLGEGKPQVISWFQGGGQLNLFRIPKNPGQTTEPWKPVIVAADLKQPEGLAAGDIDGDGKLDIVGAGRWFKHTGGDKFATHIIDDAQTPGRAAVADLKKGGRPEVVMVIGDGVGRLKWYECEGDPAKPDAWKAHDLVGAEVDHGHSLQIADINADGHLDIFCGEMAQWGGGDKPNNPDAKTWIFYGDSAGNFTPAEVVNSFDFHEAKVADMNGDGRLDIVSKPFMWKTPRLDIWLNEGSGSSAEATPAKGKSKKKKKNS